MTMKKKWCAVGTILAITMLTMMPVHQSAKVYGKTSQQLKEEQKKEQELLNQMEEEKKNLENELGGMNSELKNVSDQVLALTTQIEQLEKQIEMTTADLEEAQKKADEQYEQMKLRIQYMYESSSENQLGYIMGVASFSEVLNRAEYISDLTGYDRNLMDEFIANRDQIAATKEQLQKDKEAVEQSKLQLEEQKAGLLASIEKQKQEINDTTGDIANQESKMEELAKQIQIMIAYEKKMEEAKKPDVSAQVKHSLEQREQSKDSWGKIVVPAEGEEELLAAIIYCEAGGEPYEGMVAVGTVVLNRVNSPFFKNTITDVIYSPGQFTPVWSGRLSVVMENNLTTDACRKAAREVLEGNFMGDWLYFCTVRPSVTGDQIGGHVFY